MVVAGDAQNGAVDPFDVSSWPEVPLAARTTLPDPIVLKLTRFLLASVPTIVEAVSPGILIRPPDFRRMAVTAFGARKISLARLVEIKHAPVWNEEFDRAMYTLVPSTVLFSTKPVPSPAPVWLVISGE
jgi:hypothetical protein